MLPSVPAPSAGGGARILGTTETFPVLLPNPAQVYTPELDAWAWGPRMHERRFTTAAAALRGAVFCAGGFDGAHYLASVEMLDPRAPAWQLVRASGPSPSTLSSGFITLQRPFCSVVPVGLHAPSQKRWGHMLPLP